MPEQPLARRARIVSLTVGAPALADDTFLPGGADSAARPLADEKMHLRKCERPVGQECMQDAEGETRSKVQSCTADQVRVTAA